jgi:hypothetical protein
MFDCCRGRGRGRGRGLGRGRGSIVAVLYWEYIVVVSSLEPLS